ncbi:hypothetical protein M3Y98_00027600 [Aphelenchoides besseyi]|nr:hypothetical protein M3Y98_00027600 [Aphelenchoides besseyi]KAI6199316.1 hypothetical protein M3Y96_00613900 [Aphelenchoides besseyi]
MGISIPIELSLNMNAKTVITIFLLITIGESTVSALRAKRQSIYGANGFEIQNNNQQFDSNPSDNSNVQLGTSVENKEPEPFDLSASDENNDQQNTSNEPTDDREEQVVSEQNDEETNLEVDSDVETREPDELDLVEEQGNKQNDENN